MYYWISFTSRSHNQDSLNSHWLNLQTQGAAEWDWFVAGSMCIYLNCMIWRWLWLRMSVVHEQMAKMFGVYCWVYIKLPYTSEVNFVNSTGNIHLLSIHTHTYACWPNACIDSTVRGNKQFPKSRKLCTQACLSFVLSISQRFHTVICAFWIIHVRLAVSINQLNQTVAFSLHTFSIFTQKI